MSLRDRDNAADRKVGERWEREFCQLAGRYGKALTAQQIGRTTAATWVRLETAWHPYLLPDVTVWTAPGEHHEIKHKSPTKYDSYGLEKYRLEALVAFAQETKQPVLYTIHDWQRAGAQNRDEATENRIEDWCTADILDLARSRQRVDTPRMETWVRGERSAVPGHYWPTSLWQPLAKWWRIARAIVPAPGDFESPPDAENPRLHELPTMGECEAEGPQDHRRNRLSWPKPTRREEAA